MLQVVCAKLNLTNFKATVRLAKSDGASKPPRWNTEFIEEQLMPHEGKIERVWVCGPPAMNQLFDEGLEALNKSNKLSLSQDRIEIM